MNFWETEEWLELKKKVSFPRGSKELKEDKPLTRIQYLKLVGNEVYSEKAYQNYLSSINKNRNDSERKRNTDIKRTG